jgi:hypothetical protein
METGAARFLALSVTPSSLQKEASVTYSYDDLIIAVDGDNYGAAVSALRAGSTVLRATVNGVSTACPVTVSGVNPVGNYPVISANRPVVELEPGTSQRILASLRWGKRS